MDIYRSLKSTMARLTSIAVSLIGVGILLCFTLWAVHRSENGLYGKNDLQQTTNKTKNLLATSPTSSAATGPIFYDLNVTDADAFVRASIGPAVLNGTASSTYNPLQKCSVTTRFRLLIPSSSSSQSKSKESRSKSKSNHKKTTEKPWILQTFDARDLPKSVGGDEVYIIWKAQNGDQAVAWAHDLLDGTYELEFVQPPNRKMQVQDETDHAMSAKGRLTVFYDYSCGIGSLMPPFKENYTRAGEVQTVVMQKGVPRPPMREFVEPNRDYAIDLSKYDFVYFFGDSMIQQLARRFQTNLYWNDRIFYQENVAQSLTTTEDVDTMLQKLRDWHGSTLRMADTNNTGTQPLKKLAVVTGSSLWEILRGHVDPGYGRHEAACRSFVTRLRSEFPGVHLYWKSPSALHFHKLRILRKDEDALLRERARYMSQALPYQMYRLQKALMKELDVPFLDLYEAYYLSGPWTRTRWDARHFRDEISALLLSYYWRDLDVNGSFERLSG
jgi:hypothetical protein